MIDRTKQLPRLGFAQVVVLLSQSIYMIHEHGKDPVGFQYWATVALQPTLFVLLNFIFIAEIRRFVEVEHGAKDVFNELFRAFITGFSNILIFANAYFLYGIDDGSDGKGERDYLTSLYFSIVTWTTLGYGDLKPIGAMRLVAAFEALMGYVYMAFLIGLSLNVIKIRFKSYNPTISSHLSGSVGPSTTPSATFLREERKVPRNAPCPCGSGKRFKRCHGRLANV